MQILNHLNTPHLNKIRLIDYSKNVFKTVTTKNILNNATIFNFYFIDKIKNPDNNKV